MIVQKGGQVTKPIIVVKMPCKLLYVIQVKGFLIKCSTSKVLKCQPIISCSGIFVFSRIKHQLTGCKSQHCGIILKAIFNKN